MAANLPDDLSQVFEPDGVVRLSVESVMDLDVPDDAKSLLMEVGLPRNTGPYFQTDLKSSDRVPLLTEIAQTWGTVKSTVGLERYYVIGLIEAAHICLERKTGVVIWVGLDEKVDYSFVNSSLKHFVHFLYLIVKHRPLTSEDHGQSWLDGVRAEMESIDPLAFADESNYWPLICEEIESGQI
jgi:hypothetical protein